MSIDLSRQRSLFGAAAPAFDATFARVERRWLDATAWIDVQPGWVTGADALFEVILAARRWGQRTRQMYDNRVKEPRLTAPWRLASGEPLVPPLVEDMRRCLSRRYVIEFDSVGFNLYRDGHDSVAWHSDRILREIADPIIALVSVGERRRFLMRPKGGGPSLPFPLGEGDLLVTGGTTSRAWEHCVPKVAHAGPRISLAFRHGLDPRAYSHKQTEPVDR